MAARFDAFISYSRAASSTLAVELRNGIERFAKPWYRLRSSRVFLDDASMSANTGLWSTIERGLTEAEWFILLCSPKSAASEYVTHEITWWLEHKSADRILLVLDEGEIFWDAKAGDFDWKRADAVNPALSTAFAEEPRWVDLTWFEQEGSLRAADPRFPERVADLAAAVRGVERDELVGENVQQRRRALRLARGAIIALSGLLVASLVATVIAVVNGNAAAEQARVALARQLAAQAITLSATDLQTASLLAVEAQRLHDDAQTRAALFQLASASPYLERSLAVGAVVTGTALDAGGAVVTGDAAGTVALWVDGDRTDLMEFPGQVLAVGTSSDHQVVAGVGGGDDPAVAISIEGRIDQPDLTDSGFTPAAPPSYVSVSPDGRYVALSSYRDLTAILEEIGGGFQLTGTIPFGGEVGWGDGSFTVMSPLGDWARADLDDVTVVESGAHVIPMPATGAAVSGDGTVMAGQTTLGVNYQLWYSSGSIAPDAGGDPDASDLITTNAISGAVDTALDDTGSRFAALADGAISVSLARTRDDLPEQPLALAGAGSVNPSTLSFVGEHLANGSGEFALIWDLQQAGRISTEVEAPIADPCTACGTPVVRPNRAGTRIITTDATGFATLVTDPATGDTVEVVGEGGFGEYTGASWFDDDRIVVYARTARELRVLSGPDYTAVDLSAPIELADPEGSVLVMRADAEGRTVTVLDDQARVQSIDLASGRVVATTEALAGLGDGGGPFGYDIAPDGSTAYVWYLSTGARAADLTGRVVFERLGVDAVRGVAYDGASKLHVFDERSDTTIDPVTGDVGPVRPARVEDIPAPVLSADGAIVVSGGQTGTVQLIALDQQGTVFATIPVPVESRRFAISAFAPDGTTLLTAIQSMAGIDRPSTVRRLDLTPGGWKASACAIAGRDLTSDEWRTYVGTEPPGDLRCTR